MTINEVTQAGVKKVAAVAIDSSGNVVDVNPSGVSHFREWAALSTRETWTWPAPGVRQVVITVDQEAAGTAQLTASVGVCWDAPSDLVADTWLTAGDALAVDSNMATCSLPRELELTFTDPITRMDGKRMYGSEPLHVIGRAV